MIFYIESLISQLHLPRMKILFYVCMCNMICIENLLVVQNFYSSRTYPVNFSHDHKFSIVLVLKNNGMFQSINIKKAHIAFSFVNLLL